MGGNYEESAGSMALFDEAAQWSYQETRDFISLRAQLQADFAHAKRTKPLWEFIAGQMRERGYGRSADQCKCQWKNLALLYKGEEGSEECPFFEELRAVFAAKRSGKEKAGGAESSESEGGERASKKRRSSDRVTAERSRANSMQEVLEDFFRQQRDTEVEWRQAMERRERERRAREREWQEAMERLQAERDFMERQWLHKECQRRDREEARAQKRDALLSALIARLARQDSQQTGP